MVAASMKTKLTILSQCLPPWICLGRGEKERVNWNYSYFYSIDGKLAVVRKLRGKKMKTRQDLMNEFGAALQLFDGFGENWHALKECLQYMDEWLPADLYVLVCEDAEYILSDAETNEMEQFLTTLHQVGEWWASPITDNGRFNRSKVPFHLLMHVGADVNAFDRISAFAANVSVPLRMFTECDY